MLPFDVTMFAKQLLTDSYDLTKLTTIITGGSLLSENTNIILSNKLPNVEISVKYGMTEFSGVFAISSKNTKVGSVGYLVDGLSVKVRTK